MSDIERLEKVIEKMSEQSKVGMDKLNESMTTLLIAQTAFYEHKETITRDVEKLENAFFLYRDKTDNKFDKISSEISNINTAIGQGNVLDDINKHKLKNMLPWFITCVMLVITLIDNFN